MNSKNKISSTMSQKRSELFRDHFRTISRVNRLLKFNDRDGIFKVIKFLTQFGSNVLNRTQSFIIMINLNNTERHVAYLVHILLIVCWLNQKYSMSDVMIVIFEVFSKRFIWHFLYVCERLSRTYFNFFQMKSIKFKDLCEILINFCWKSRHDFDEISVSFNKKSRWDFDKSWFKISQRSRSILI